MQVAQLNAQLGRGKPQIKTAIEKGASLKLKLQSGRGEPQIETAVGKGQASN